MTLTLIKNTQKRKESERDFAFTRHALIFCKLKDAFSPRVNANRALTSTYKSSYCPRFFAKCTHVMAHLLEEHVREMRKEGAKLERYAKRTPDTNI